MKPLYRTRYLLILVALCPSSHASEHAYPLPKPGSDLVGRMAVVKAREEDTLVDIARRHQIGQEEIVLANPLRAPWSRWTAGTRGRAPK